MQKGFIGVLIVFIFLLIVVGGGAYYLGRQTTSKSYPSTQVITSQPSINTSVTPRPNWPDFVGYSNFPEIPDRQYTYNWETITASESAAWNTYIDKTNNLSLQYPQDWIQTTNGSSIVLTPQQEGLHGGGFPRGISITVYTSNQGLSSLDYVKKEILPTGGFTLKYQPPYFAVFDATVVDGLPGAGSPEPTAYISNKKGIIIEIGADSLDNNTLVSKIFSTFKFTN